MMYSAWLKITKQYPWLFRIIINSGLGPIQAWQGHFFYTRGQNVVFLLVPNIVSSVEYTVHEFNQKITQEMPYDYPKDCFSSGLQKQKTKAGWWKIFHFLWAIDSLSYISL